MQARVRKFPKISEKRKSDPIFYSNSGILQIFEKFLKVCQSILKSYTVYDIRHADSVRVKGVQIQNFWVYSAANKLNRLELNRET